MPQGHIAGPPGPFLKSCFQTSQPLTYISAWCYFSLGPGHFPLFNSMSFLSQSSSLSLLALFVIVPLCKENHSGFSHINSPMEDALRVPTENPHMFQFDCLIPFCGICTLRSSNCEKLIFVSMLLKK